MVVTISADAATAVKDFPDLVRDVIDDALSVEEKQRAVDILGANDNIDAAISTTTGGFAIAVVNHNKTPLNLTLKPLNSFSGRSADWIDFGKNGNSPIYSGNQPLTLAVPADGFRAIEWKATDPSPALHLHGPQTGSVR